MESTFLADTDMHLELARLHMLAEKMHRNKSKCDPTLLYFGTDKEHCSSGFLTKSSNEVRDVGTYNDTGPQGPPRDEELARVEIIVQAVILLLAVVGNGLVLCALRFRKTKTSRLRYFIMHLTIADLLVAFCNILPQLAWDITFRFHGTDFLCRVVKFLQIFVIYLSTYILVLTSIDRYRAICHPRTFNRWTRKHCAIAVALTWCLSAVFASPQLAIFSMQEIAPNTQECWATFEPEWTLLAYVTSFFATVYIIPFIILVYLYGRICYEVCQNLYDTKDNEYGNGIVYKFNGTGHISIIGGIGGSGKYSGGEAASPASHHSHNHVFMNNTIPPSSQPRRHGNTHKAISKSKIKTVKLTFVVVVAYLICWSPFIIVQMWWAYDADAPTSNSLFVICLLLASLNSCVNPWIYMAFSGNLMRQVLPCVGPKKPKQRERVRSMDDIQKQQAQEMLMQDALPKTGGRPKGDSSSSAGHYRARLMSLKNTLFSKSTQQTKLTGNSDNQKSKYVMNGAARYGKGTTSPQADLYNALLGPEFKQAATRSSRATPKLGSYQRGEIVRDTIV